MEKFEYANDAVEMYADEATRRLDHMIKCGNWSDATTKYLVYVEMLKESTGKPVCGQRSKSTVCCLEDERMKQFR